MNDQPYNWYDDDEWLDLDEVEWDDSHNPVIVENERKNSALVDREFWALVDGTWTPDEENRIEKLLVSCFK